MHAVEWTPSREGEYAVAIRLTGDGAASTAPIEPTRIVRVLDLSAVAIVGLQNDVVGVQQRFTRTFSCALASKRARGQHFAIYLVDWAHSGGLKYSRPGCAR